MRSCSSTTPTRSAGALRKRGEDRTTALLEAGPTRLRPILMTTLSIIFGLAPVALGFEEGSELLRAAAVVLIGGLITSTLLTLVVVPAMYTIFDDINRFIMRIAHRIAKPRELEPEELMVLHPNGVYPVDGVVHAQPALDGVASEPTPELATRLATR